jgi:hypothetical protein
LFVVGAYGCTPCVRATNLLVATNPPTTWTHIYTPLPHTVTHDR